MDEINNMNSIQNYIGTYSFEPKSEEFTLEQLATKSSGGKRTKFGEIICIGSTFLILIILTGIWVVYEIRESDV